MKTLFNSVDLLVLPGRKHPLRSALLLSSASIPPEDLVVSRSAFADPIFYCRSINFDFSFLSLGIFSKS
jgi:hypothetical protein